MRGRRHYRFRISHIAYPAHTGGRPMGSGTKWGLEGMALNFGNLARSWTKNRASGFIGSTVIGLIWRSHTMAGTTAFTTTVESASQPIQNTSSWAISAFVSTLQPQARLHAHLMFPSIVQIVFVEKPFGETHLSVLHRWQAPSAARGLRRPACLHDPP